MIMEIKSNLTMEIMMITTMMGTTKIMTIMTIMTIMRITTMMNKSEIKVISTLERVGTFISAQELYRALQRDGERIGLTTVYRSLQSLVNDKMVDVLRRDDGESIYRLCGEAHHHHLVCKRCGTTVEIEGSAIEEWAKMMALEHGFQEVDHVAEIYGLCGNCS
jgi:Fur family ferric uptake transcriptional regulator